MIQAFLLALLAFLALLGVALPLLRGGRPVAERAAFDQAVYRDQLRELDRDIERGLVTAEEAESSRLEIQRRLLAADRRQARAARLSRSPVLAGAVMVFVAGGAIATYLALGSPGLPDVPFAGRPPQQAEAHGEDTAQMRNAVEALAKRLQQNPNDGPGWLLFARSLSTMGDYDRAEMAYREAMKLGRDSAEVQADHAEMLVMQANGIVTPAAEEAFRKVLATDPDNIAGRYYLALARMQAGEPKRAIEGLQGLLAILPSDSPLREQIGAQVAEAAKAAGIPAPPLEKGTGPAPKQAAGAPPTQKNAAPGPSAADMAAASEMSENQREAMIRGMVANLAAKQEAEPGNFDGWMRLGRAYAVLKDSAKSAEAFAKARALRPDDLSVPEAEAQVLMTGYKPGDKVPTRVVELLTQVAAKDPNRPEALWYLGLAASMDGNAAEARRRWTALKTLLPAGSEDRKMVEAALATLPGDAAPTLQGGGTTGGK